jgi:hypothetical protein
MCVHLLALRACLDSLRSAANSLTAIEKYFIRIVLVTLGDWPITSRKAFAFLGSVDTMNIASQQRNRLIANFKRVTFPIHFSGVFDNAERQVKLNGQPCPFS